jgi:N-acetyl-anhydromuramyl-L-alanine amidase AmpD
VLHTEAGTQQATATWFSNPGSQVSAHFAVGLDGQLLQFVSLEHQAWANGILEPGNRWVWLSLPGNPNGWTISIETEDLGSGSTEVTQSQFEGVLTAARLSLQRYPGIDYLLAHNDISPRSRAHCPGDRWVASMMFDSLAEILGLKTLV